MRNTYRIARSLYNWINHNPSPLVTAGLTIQDRNVHPIHTCDLQNSRLNTVLTNSSTRFQMQRRDIHSPSRSKTNFTQNIVLMANYSGLFNFLDMLSIKHSPKDYDTIQNFVCIVPKFWVTRASINFDDKIWGQAPTGFPQSAQNLCRELMFNFNKQLTMKQVAQLQQYAVYKISLIDNVTVIHGHPVNVDKNSNHYEIKISSDAISSVAWNKLKPKTYSQKITTPLNNIMFYQYYQLIGGVESNTPPQTDMYHLYDRNSTEPVILQFPGLTAQWTADDFPLARLYAPSSTGTFDYNTYEHVTLYEPDDIIVSEDKIYATVKSNNETYRYFQPSVRIDESLLNAVDLAHKKIRNINRDLYVESDYIKTKEILLGSAPTSVLSAHNATGDTKHSHNAPMFFHTETIRKAIQSEMTALGYELIMFDHNFQKFCNDIEDRPQQLTHHNAGELYIDFLQTMGVSVPDGKKIYEHIFPNIGMMHIQRLFENENITITSERAAFLADKIENFNPELSHEEKLQSIREWNTSQPISDRLDSALLDDVLSKQFNDPSNIPQVKSVQDETINITSSGDTNYTPPSHSLS